MKILNIYFLLFVVFMQIIYAGEIRENQNLFNLSENPFINEGKYAVFFSYSFNQGPPSLIIDEWQLPNDSKNFLFNEYKAGLSIGGRFSLVYKKIIGNKLEFNSSYIGINTTPTINHFGLNYKIYKSENYYPDYSLGINTQNNQECLTIDFMLGSMREKFKYYTNIAVGFFYYIPFPYKFTVGVSYEITNDLNLFIEFQPVGDSDDQFNAILLGLSYNVFRFLECQCALYYFDFDFKNSIPNRDPTGRRDPSHIITVPEKDQYYLFSLRINFALNEKIF